jgi:hypothetical protein
MNKEISNEVMQNIINIMISNNTSKKCENIEHVYVYIKDIISRHVMNDKYYKLLTKKSSTKSNNLTEEELNFLLT